MRVVPLILLALLVACSGGTEPTGRARLVVWPNPDTLPAGSSLQLHAYLITADDDTILDVSPVWASRNPDIASVSPDGVVTGVQSGQVTIAGQTPEARGSATVRVERRFHALDVAVGSTTCAVDLEGRAWCTNGFGSGVAYPSGDSTDVREFTMPVAGLAQFRLIGSNSSMACGLDDAGAAWCWGYGIIGQSLSSGIPVRVEAATTFDTLSVAGVGACGLTGGEARCWGSLEQNIQSISVPATSLQSIAVGVFDQCGISTSNDVYCWRVNEPIPGMAASGFASVSLGDNRACGIQTNSDAACFELPWGGGVTPLPGNLTLKQVTLGQGFTCELTISGIAYCSGANDQGQLGTGDSIPRSVPEAVVGGHLFTKLAVSPGSGSGDDTVRVCGIATSTELYCWGQGYGPVPSPVLY